MKVRKDDVEELREDLRSQGPLELLTTHELLNAKSEPISKEIDHALNEMKSLCHQAQDRGDTDQARWMCPQVQKALEDIHCNLKKDTDHFLGADLALSGEEAYKNELFKSLQFHRKCRDTTEASRIFQSLLQRGWINVLTDPTATDVYTDCIEPSLANESSATRNTDGILPPLHRLVNEGSVTLFPILQKAAANGWTPQPDFFGRTLLHVAARKGHTLLLEHLLTLGKAHPNFKLDIEARDGASRTPLYLAIHHGHESAYRLLRRNNASPHNRNAASRSALASAAGGNHVGIMEDLIAHG